VNHNFKKRDNTVHKLKVQIRLLKIKQNSRSKRHSLEPLPTLENLPNLPFVLINTSRIIDLLECLARHAAAHIRASGGRHQSPITQFVNSVLPRLRRLRSGIDALQSLFGDQINSITDPATLDLGRAGAIGKESWAVRPVDVEHVGVAADSGPEVCVGGCLPFVLEIGAVDALQSHASHASGCDIETRGECHDINLVDLTVGGLNARFGELDDPVAAFLGDVDNVDVVLVEHFVVVLLEARTFCERLEIERSASVVREATH
jgi:hypothetical protein